MNNKLQAECVEYFKNQKGFHRAFGEMRRKWKSYGKVAGKIKLSAASREERETLGKFLGTTYRDKFFAENEGELVFRFEDFEKALQATRFGNVLLTELLEGYFGEKLISNSEQREREEQGKAVFWDSIAARMEAQGEEYEQVLRWLWEMRNVRQYGYALVMRLWKKRPQTAEEMLWNVCNALVLAEQSKEEGIMLAVLAARVSGNPHYFDRGQNAALLLLHAVCWTMGAEIAQSASDVQKILWDAGIVIDEIASTVAVYKLHMIKNGKKYEALEGFNKEEEPGILSLANLRGVSKAFSDAARVFVVENEMVFHHLTEQMKGKNVALICSSGQPSCAVQRLLGLLSASGTQLYYSGDMDPEGLEIADRLWRKYPQNIYIWRMGCEDYKKAVSEEVVEEWRFARMKDLGNAELRRTAEMLRGEKRAAYQENILEEMTRDILAVADSQVG